MRGALAEDRHELLVRAAREQRRRGVELVVVAEADPAGPVGGDQRVERDAGVLEAAQQPDPVDVARVEQPVGVHDEHACRYQPMDLLDGHAQPTSDLLDVDAFGHGGIVPTN